jgi:hypothetical protein
MRQSALAATISEHASGQNNLKQRHGSSQYRPQPACSLETLPALLDLGTPGPLACTPFQPPRVESPQVSGAGSTWTVIGAAESRLLAGVHEATSGPSTFAPVDAESCAELPQPSALWMPNRSVTVLCSTAVPRLQRSSRPSTHNVQIDLDVESHPCLDHYIGSLYPMYLKILQEYMHGCASG